jgi:MFS transporter, PCFT/HCP family, solute carrier family 46, member 3
MGLIGKFYYSIMFTINAWQSSWPLYTTLYTATLPSALTGADLAIFMAAFSYIVDITTPEVKMIIPLKMFLPCLKCRKGLSG